MAGFIGFHLATLHSRNFDLVGIDNINSYYDLTKKSRLKNLKDKITL